MAGISAATSFGLPAPFLYPTSLRMTLAGGALAVGAAKRIMRQT